MYFQKEAQEILAVLQNRPEPWLIFLEGDLGAGKTTFVQSFLSLFEIPPSEVQSPTFLKLLTYEIPNSRGGGQVLHMDAYRMEEPEELEKLGLGHYENARIWLIEWPKVFQDYFSKNSMEIQYLKGATEISINIDLQHNLKFALL